MEVPFSEVDVSVMEINSNEVSPSKCIINWPSKSSVLETPERKRFRHSLSFGDSGLGSSLFSSPPDTVSMRPIKTSPLLRTPTDRSGRSADSYYCTATPSPIRSFVHMSSYSSAFSSPELRKCSVSNQELRLSNPENATGYQFSGASLCKNRANPINMASGDIIAHSRPLSVKQYHFTTPSTSRASNRALILPSPGRDFGTENEEKVADITIPYGIPETPSKCFGESIDRSMFGADDFAEIATSTPMRDIADGQMEVVSFHSSYPRIFEQPSGPLESSICDSFEAPVAVPGVFVSPSKITLSAGGSSFGRSRSSNQKYSGTLVEEDRLSANAFTEKQRRTDDSGYMDAEKSRGPEFRESDSRPFKPPIKPLKPFSRLWSQITFGETKHQREMTRYAHSFLEDNSTSSIK